MNKKAQTNLTGIIIGIFLVLIFIGIFLYIILIGNASDQKTEIKETDTLKLYLESRDSVDNKQLESEYVLITEKGVLLSQGKLDKDSFLEISGIPKEEKINIFCFGGNHYTSRNQKIFTQVEKDNNASKFTCLQDSIGSLKVNHSGDLNKTENTIKFSISSNSFKGLSAVVSWSSGIISVDVNEMRIECEIEWANYTYYNNETKQYLYLPSKNYICQDKIRECDSIQNNLCIIKENIPERYIGKVDKAISTGKDLSQETYELILTVRTDEVKIPSDFIELRFYDKDLVSLGNGQFQYLSEKDGNNIGIPNDFVYRVEYQQQ